MSSDSKQGGRFAAIRDPAALIIPVGLLAVAVAAYQSFGPADHSAVASAPSSEVAASHAEDLTFSSEVERGAHLFRNNCAGCHGEQGRRGIPNPNYSLGHVPPLSEMADHLMLWEPEDADAVIAMINGRIDPRSRADEAPFPNYHRFLAQFDAVKSVIRNGSHTEKLHPDGPKPFDMPAWDDRLAEDDIEAILAYLISVFDWGAEMN